MTATRGAANRRRGANAERAVVAWLRANGYPHARRYLAGDGRQPGDVDGVPGVCIEVKDRASSAWPTWRAQVLAEAGPNIPVVVRRTRGVTDVGLWECEVPLLWDHWQATLSHLWLWGCTECPRTRMSWVRLPFGELMEALR